MLERFCYPFFDVLEALCLPVLWSKSHIFQFMHRQETIFFIFLKQSYFWPDPRINKYNPSRKMFGQTKRFRIDVRLCTDIGHCTTQMDSTKYFLTHFTSQVGNYFDAFLGILLTLKYPKMWRNSVPTKSEKYDLLPMHSLKKVRFWSKCHWTGSLKKVQKHDFRFYTVEERFKIWSRAA